MGCLATAGTNRYVSTEPTTVCGAYNTPSMRWLIQRQARLSALTLTNPARVASRSTPSDGDALAGGARLVTGTSWQRQGGVRQRGRHLLAPLLHRAGKVSIEQSRVSQRA